MRVSFEIGRDEMVGLIGPNGAGKTTLIRLITGILKPTSGKVKFKGEDITGLAIWKIVNKGISVNIPSCETISSPAGHCQCYGVLPLSKRKKERRMGQNSRAKSARMHWSSVALLILLLNQPLFCPMVI